MRAATIGLVLFVTASAGAAEGEAPNRQTPTASERRIGIKARKLEQQIAQLLRQLNAARRELAELRGEELPEGNLYLEASGDPVEIGAPPVKSPGEFAYEQVSYNEANIGIRVIGRVQNNTGKAWRMATFSLEISDSKGRILEVTPFVIAEIAAGETRAFSTLARVPHQTGLEISPKFDTGVDAGL